MGGDLHQKVTVGPKGSQWAVIKMEIFKAHKQWSERPADERFTSIQALHDATKDYAADAAQKNVPFADLRVEARDGDVELVGRANVPAQLTNWAFGQLCARADAPASYLRTLPATLACQNINYGLAHRPASANGSAQLLFHKNGGLLLRSLTTDVYSRIWNYEIAERLLDLGAKGWLPANECQGAIATWSRGQQVDCPLYASDHDMFAFVAHPNAYVREADTHEPLFRGVMVENSEVGASALKMTRFLYRAMCGNHIIWGASRVLEISVRHVGNVRERFANYAYELRRYAESSVSDEEAKIAAAKTRIIAQGKEQVLDTLFGKRSVGLSRKLLEAGYDAVEPGQDGSPNTVWGIVQGLTRHSQTVPFADKRTDIDRAAGRIMELVF